MTVAGTVLPVVRARLVELLGARLAAVAVSYHPPRHHEDLTTPASGDLEAVWMVGLTEAAGVEPESLGTPVRVREEWMQTVVAQVLGRDTSSRQQDLDGRCADILGEIMEEVASNPYLGLNLDGWGRPSVTARSWRWSSGVLYRGGGTPVPNARVELDLRVQASRC